MKRAGLKIFNEWKNKKSANYSYENDILTLDPDYEKQFNDDKAAWGFFTKQAPSYRKATINWIMSAKQEKTRQQRLNKAINASGMNQKIY